MHVVKQNKFFLASQYSIPLEVFLKDSQYKQYRNRERWLIFAEHNFQCVYCKMVGQFVVFWKDDNQIRWDSHVDLAAIYSDGRRVMMTIDHVIPKSKGGSNQRDNKVCACSPCNHKKEDKLLEPELYLQIKVE